MAQAIVCGTYGFGLIIALGCVAEFLPGWAAASFASGVLLCGFIGLEGNGMRIAHYERKGWAFRQVIEAQNRATAEELYFSSAGSYHDVENSSVKMMRPAPAPVWPMPASAGSSGEPVLGLMDFEGKG